MKQTPSIPLRIWLVFIVFGLVGQIAWTIENMYLNLYIYKTVTYDPNAIAIMVAVTAVVATLTTLLMGALSDKLGKRKAFMTCGYILWGLSIGAFGYINKTTMENVFPQLDVIAVTVTAIILLDCLMTFLGSTANDAAFQAWVTDVTNPQNRGKAEGLLATMPLIGMLVVFGLFDPLTQQAKWKTFFIVVGLMVTGAGVLGLFLIRDERIVRKETNYLKDLLYGFKPSTIRTHRNLYLIFLIVCLLGIAQQVFLPYIIIYFEYYLGITHYAIILGLILISSSLISIIGGQFVDRHGKRGILLCSVIVYFVAMFIIFLFGRFWNGMRWLMLGMTTIVAILMMGAYLVAMVVLNALGRDLVPKEHIGVFSGIRMIFFVMIPMVIGPIIGSTIIRNSPSTYVDEFGVIQSTPIPEIFLGGAFVGLLVMAPLYILLNTLKGGVGYEAT